MGCPSLEMEQEPSRYRYFPRLTGAGGLDGTHLSRLMRLLVIDSSNAVTNARPASSRLMLSSHSSVVAHFSGIAA